MYKCEDCGKQQVEGVRCHLIAIQTREKVYPPRRGDPGGTGHETVREIRVCPPCERKY